MRVFAALPLPPHAKRDVEGVIESLRQRHPRLRYVKPSGMHITLHFFGELGESAVSGLRRIWKDPELCVPDIPASLGGLGQFPERGNPRVVWIGVDEGKYELTRYAGLFARKIAPLGYAPDPRGFSPHITLARNSGERPGADWLQDVSVPATVFSFQECVLFQSILEPGGAEYVPLCGVTFKRTSDASS